MGNIKSFREIMEHACINRAEIHNETAELEFDVSGTEDGKALITYFGGEWMIEQFFVSVTHYERIEEPEDGLDEEFWLVEEDSFYENLEIVNCHCSLSVNIQNGDIAGSIVFTGTHEEKPFTAEPIHFDADHVFIQSEGTDLLLFLTEQHSELSKNPADHYEEEIKNLFFCDSVRRHVKTLVDSFLGALEDKKIRRKFSVMPISFALCPISPLDEIPMGDTTLKYIHTEISPENYGKFDTICSSLMHDPALPYSQYAGNKDFCLTRADGELPELLFSAVTVSSTKPCAYKTTETLDFMVKLLKQEFGKHGINVSDPILLAKETYKSKFSENCETCKRSFTDLCCGGCSHKTGFSNKYSDYICDHGIYVNLSKKLEFQQ